MKDKEEKFEIKDQAMWLTTDLKQLLQEVYDHYRSVALQNDYLRKENERLKSEAYKDEELAKMKKEYDEMKEDYYRGFPISKKEDEKIKKWIEKQTEGEDLKTKAGGAIGGRFTYKFYCTSIGTIGVVKDGNTGEEFTFRDLC